MLWIFSFGCSCSVCFFFLFIFSVRKVHVKKSSIYGFCFELVCRVFICSHSQCVCSKNFKVFYLHFCSIENRKAKNNSSNNNNQKRFNEQFPIVAIRVLEHVSTGRRKEKELWLSFFGHFCVALYSHWIFNTIDVPNGIVFSNFIFISIFTLFDVTWYVLEIYVHDFYFFHSFFFLCRWTQLFPIRFPIQTKRIVVIWYVFYVKCVCVYKWW